MTEKVIDFEVVSKVCNQCSQMKGRLNEEEFEEWWQSHDCQGWYKGSSPTMEMECAKQLWGRNTDQKVMYKWMISDGDSKSYNAVWNIYGVCDT